MPRTLAIAWREFKATALTRAFLLAAVIVPILMIALAVIGPMLFNPKPPPLEGTIAIVDPSGALALAAHVEFAPEKIRERIGATARARAQAPSGLVESGGLEPGMGRNPRSASAVTREFEINLTLDDDHAPAELDTLKAQLAAGELVAVVTTAEAPSSQGAPATGPAEAVLSVPPIHATLYVPSNMNVKHTGLIEDLVQAATSRARIRAAGLDVDTVRGLAARAQPQTVRISRDGQERAEGAGTKIFKMFVPMAFMMLIWMGAFVSGQSLLTTTIEEKSNKVMEVLLSAVSPMQLMTGKIVGQAFVGMVMVSMYLGMGLAALIGLAMADLVEWRDLMFFGLYYVMAYFMIASIMAAIGSAVNELREAQSLMTPAMLVLMIPLMLWLPISDSPNGMLATVTSFIPPLIPFVMILRVAGNEPIPAWQVILSLAVGYPAMIAMMWMAARVFRVGVLMYGKPPSPRELLKWVRYS